MTRLSFILQRQWLTLILGAVLGALLISCFFGPLGPADLLVLRQHRVKLIAVRDRLLADNAQLTDRVTRLRSDDAFMQRLIRRELGYTRRDEFVYRFPDHSTQH